jgi:hypothetical protein
MNSCRVICDLNTQKHVSSNAKGPMLWGWLRADWIYISQLFVRVISSSYGRDTVQFKP